MGRPHLVAIVVGCAACSSSPMAPMDAMPPSGVAQVPLTSTVHADGLSAPVDLVRDEWGIPHIYGESLLDVAFAQGYVMAEDRLVMMDLARHLAEGTLSELF